MKLYNYENVGKNIIFFKSWCQPIRNRHDVVNFGIKIIFLLIPFSIHETL